MLQYLKKSKLPNKEPKIIHVVKIKIFIHLYFDKSIFHNLL